MAVGENIRPTLHAVDGVRLGTANARIKNNDKDDLLLIEVSEGATVSGVFTQNAFCAAPVILAKKHIAGGSTQYLIVNSGNANACTGERGLQDALSLCKQVAKASGVDVTHVLPFSTGVIGEYLPMEKLLSALPAAFESLSHDHWQDAAHAIMTTDTRPKEASIQFEYDGETITLTGVAKGAGMIRPNMATMLAYVATDAVVAQSVLDDLLSASVNRSFNRITVDGDTSTNDACILIATGQAGLPMLSESGGELYRKLESALTDVMQSLARGIIKDAEGASKFVAIHVGGGANSEESLQVAYAIAHSPLVKTALYASDANWGRIVCAIGYSGILKLDPHAVDVWLDDVQIVERGQRASSYTEAAGSKVVAQESFALTVNLNRGSCEETVWTSDLSHDYITINAEYRT